MKSSDKKGNRILVGFIQGCGAIAAGLGFLAILGWIANLPRLASFGPNNIPMAPSTALLFLWFGIGTITLARARGNHSAHRLGMTIGFLGIIVALPLFFLSSLDIHPEFERLGIRIAVSTDGVPIGHMSPLTAFCFVLSGLSLLTSPALSSDSSWRTAAAFVFAVSVVLTGFTLFLAYLFGSPLLYGSGIIPPALTTSLAFLLLGAALVVLSGQRTWLFDRLSDAASTRSVYFLILVFMIQAVGIITAVYLYHWNHEKNFRAEVERQLSIVADLKVSELVQWRRERLGDGAVFHQNDNFTGLVRRYLERPGDAYLRARFQKWLDCVLVTNQYDRVALVDTEGKERISAPRTTEPVVSHLVKDATEVLRTGEVAFLDFHRDAPDRPIHLAVLVPIHDTQGSGRPLGVLRLRIDPGAYLYPLINRWPTPSRTAESLLVRRDGNDVLFLNTLRFQKNTALALRSSLEDKHMPAVKAVLGQSGIVEGTDYRGVPVIAAVRAIPDSPWFLVARMDTAEIYAPLRERMWMMIVLIGALFLSAGAITGLIWRQQRIGFYKERYQAAEALRISESRFRSALDNMLEGCQIIGFDWRYLYVNDASAISGRQPREDLLGHTITERYPGIERTEMFAVLQHCMEKRTARHLENEFTYPDGVKRWFELSIQPVSDGIFILSLDITDRKRAEERERHLNAVLRAIRRVNQLITREKNRDCLIQEACAILTSTRGFKSAWIALVDEKGAFLEMAESGLSQDCRYLMELLKRGEWPRCARDAFIGAGVVTVADSASSCIDCPLASYHGDHGVMASRLEQNGKVYGVIVVSPPREWISDSEDQELFKETADDVAFAISFLEQEERKNEAEAAFRESENKFKTLFEYAPDAIYLYDFEGRFIDGNRAAEALSGYKKEDLIGRSFLEVNLLSPEEMLKASKLLQRNMEGKPTGPDPVVLKRKDGKSVTVEIRTFPLKLGGQDVVLAIGRDISERIKLEEQLRQSQKLEGVGRLAGGIAHDFNNLLTTVIGYSDLILEGVMNEGAMREGVKEIRAAGERASSLTRQLLAFSRKQVLQPTVMNLNDTVRDLDKMLRRIIGEDIELRTVLSPELGQVEADKGQIEQVIMNLVINARDAMPRGGKLTIETAAVVLDETYAENHVAVMPGDYVMLSISDTGSGMTREIQAQIFEPFFTTKEKGKGTGLGLSMVYGIVKQSKGNIWVYSEPDKGTSFKIYLPLVEKSTSEALQKVKKEDNPTGSETILIVEDDERVRNLAEKVLKGFGYTVLTAAGGEEAIIISRKHKGRIHLLLTDVVMPGMSSRDLEEHLRPLRPDMKILYMSGYTDNVIVHHGVLDPGKAFLEKPFTPDSLGRKVREVLGG